jgi:hypothetical protein
MQRPDSAGALSSFFCVCSVRSCFPRSCTEMAHLRHYPGLVGIHHLQISGEMKAWKVGKAVGNVRNVGPELSMEWSGPSDSLFGQ